jgi:hypothetical protein
MPQFMLLLHDRPSVLAGMSPADMQAVIERYLAWSRALRARGAVVDGRKLTRDTGRLMRRGSDGLLVTDGPYAESKEVIGGFFVIEARDYDDAVAVASGCPHLDYHGTIEVRQVDRS